MIIGFVIYQITKINFQIKSSGIKKSEIINEYKNKLDALETKEEKVVYLKTINQELSRNIFFEQNEIREIIQDFVKRII